MIQIKLSSDYAPLQQLPFRDNNKTQTGKEWANQRQPYFLLIVVLGVDKENISLGADSGGVSLGVALFVLLKMERVV